MKTNNQTAGLFLENVCIRLDGSILMNMSVSIAPGETLTLMGPSGSGKSSFLAYIAGFLAPEFDASGVVKLNGKTLADMPSNQRRIGVLFQDDLLFPHMSVAGNLMFAIPSSVKGRDARKTSVEQALHDIDMAGYGPRDPATLSGGQRARIALMRVLLSEPLALLLDEPFSKLDSALRDQMRKLVFEKARMLNLPTLMVTHDIADAQAAGGRVIEIGSI